MDDVAVKLSLYEEDFYAWTSAQAALLREGRLDEIDIANILEEIESLGRSLVTELRSRLKILAQHLLKEIYQPEKASRSWATTIVNQRDEIEQLLDGNPSLKPQTSEVFAKAYASARKTAAAETGIPLKTFPKDRPSPMPRRWTKTSGPVARSTTGVDVHALRAGARHTMCLGRVQNSSKQTMA